METASVPSFPTSSVGANLPHSSPGFFQDPDTYTAIKSGITPLGEVQEYQLGAMLRRIYADPASETAIVDLSPEVVVASQLSSTADGGGSRASFDSAVALWQGFYPPAPAYVQLQRGRRRFADSRERTAAFRPSPSLTVPISRARSVDISTFRSMLSSQRSEEHTSELQSQ